MMTNYQKFRTTSGPTTSEAAAWIIACFVSATLLALALFPAEASPWLAKLIEALA